MLNKWKLQSCKNYEFGHYLQALLYRKKGNLNESLKFMKLCHLIDASNPVFLKELAKTLYPWVTAAAFSANTRQP